MPDAKFVPKSVLPSSALPISVPHPELYPAAVHPAVVQPPLVARSAPPIALQLHLRLWSFSRATQGWLAKLATNPTNQASSRLTGSFGQTTAEYALVLLGAATVALLVLAWATGSGKVEELLNRVFDSIISKVS